jgi:hypothetical protein
MSFLPDPGCQVTGMAVNKAWLFQPATQFPSHHQIALIDRAERFFMMQLQRIAPPARHDRRGRFPVGDGHALRHLPAHAARWRLPRRLALCVAGLLLAGCATSPAYQESDPTPADKSDLYLYRPSAAFKFLVPADVLVNGRKVGQLFSGSYLRLRLAPGRKRLRIAPGDFAINSELEIKAKPGEARFYRYELTLDSPDDLFVIKGHIEPRNKEEALADMQTLRPGYLQPPRDR